MTMENGYTGHRIRFRRPRLHHRRPSTKVSHRLDEMQYENRSWSLDVLECPRCFGRMKIVAAIHSSEAIRKILICLGLPVRAPPIAKPSPDGPIEEPIIF